MRNNKNFVLAMLLMSTILFSACNSNKSISGNGAITNKQISVDDFSAIRISGAANIVYTQDNSRPPYVNVEIDENLVEYLDIKTENGTLLLNFIDGANISPTTYNISTNSKDLQAITVSGFADITIKSLLTDKLLMKISGRAAVNIDHIECQQLEMKISGNATLAASGKAKETSYAISGKATINTTDLEQEYLSTSISGRGDFNVYVTGTMKNNISGRADINYRGNPEITNNVSGKININKIEE